MSKGDEEEPSLLAVIGPFDKALGLGTVRGSTGGAGGLVSCCKGKKIHTKYARGSVKRDCLNKQNARVDTTARRSQIPSFVTFP